MPLTSLLQPIPDADAAGIDVSFLPEFDAIQEARRADDPSLDQGEWSRDLKAADWPRVARLCREALTERTKDLRIAGWYLEARTQIDGLPGLAEGYSLLAALCEIFWSELHPRDDDSEERLGCLRWVVGQSLLWLRLLAATPPDEASVAVTATLDAIDRIEAVLDTNVPGDGPSMRPLRDALEMLRPDVRASSAEALTVSPSPCASAVAADMRATPAQPAQTGSRNSCGIADRVEALCLLRDVAGFFRETEPHSPVAYLADKAARWGAMSLHEWLGQVLGEGEALKRMRDALDISEGDQDA